MHCYGLRIYVKLKFSCLPHEGTKRGQRYSSTHSESRHWMGWVVYFMLRPLCCGKERWYPLNLRLRWPYGSSDEEKNFLLGLSNP
jgi:hypothetical protein